LSSFSLICSLEERHRILPRIQAACAYLDSGGTRETIQAEIKRCVETLKAGQQTEAVETLNRLATSWNGSVGDLDLVTSQLIKCRDAVVSLEVAQALADLRDFIRKACCDLSDVQIKDKLGLVGLKVLDLIDAYRSVQDIDAHNGRDTKIVSKLFNGVVTLGTKMIQAKVEFDRAMAGKNYNERAIALQDWRLHQATFEKDFSGQSQQTALAAQGK
jgi:hypothetical protein